MSKPTTNVPRKRTVPCGACGARLPHISMLMLRMKGPDYEAAMAARIAHIRTHVLSRDCEGRTE